MKTSEARPGLFQFFDYAAGKESLRSLHLMTQIVGKVKLKLFPERPNFQHVTLVTDTRGFTTRPIQYRGIAFEIVIDLTEMVCRMTTSDGRSSVITLRIPIATFYKSFVQALANLNIDVPIKAEPYDIPGETTPSHGLRVPHALPQRHRNLPHRAPAAHAASRRRGRRLPPRLRPS